MRTRKLAVAAASAAMLSVMVTGPANSVGPGATGPVGVTVTEEARAPFHADAKLPVTAGNDVVVHAVTIEPGDAVGWYQTPAAAMFTVQAGSLTSYSSCADYEAWPAGHTYAQTKGSGVSLLKNEGKSPAQVMAIFTDVPAGEKAFASADAPEGCAIDGGGAKVAELGRGTAVSSGLHEATAGKALVVDRFLFEPGYTSGWHRHPGTNLIVHLKGTTANYTDCTTKEEWLAGKTYMHVPSEEHDGHPNLTKNESADEQSEMLTVLFNVPGDQPAGVTPITPTPPPSDCPTLK